MPDRPKLGPSSGVIPGMTFFTEYQTAMKGLWDSSCLPLTGVAGTADDVEAVLDWPLDAGLVDGMKFTLTWAATNTGPMTLRLVWSGGNTAQIDVLTAEGDVMNPGTAETGTRAMVEYIGGAFRVLGGGGEGGAMAYYEALTTSGDWTKPLGFLDDAMVLIEGWGGGGGGGSGGRAAGTANAYGGGGGGGGGYWLAYMRYVDVPSVVPYSIGAGGAGGAGITSTGPGNPGSAGGDTTFGTILTAKGGAGGLGGVITGSGPSALGGSWPFNYDGSLNPTNPVAAVHQYAGGNGAAVNISGGSGRAIWGGGGGAGGGNKNSGVGAQNISMFGGNGGAPPAAAPANGPDGHSPGGGGSGSRGANAPTGTGGFGARGEIRIWIM